MLPFRKVQVPSLFRELRSHTTWGVAKKKKIVKGIKDDCRIIFLRYTHSLIHVKQGPILSSYLAHELVLISVAGLARLLDISNAYWPSSFSLVLFLMFWLFLLQ